MDERTVGRIRRIEDGKFKDLEDRSLLTGFEHKILGSTPGNLMMTTYPRIPQAILEGSKSIEEVNAQRQEQIWFVDTSIVYELGGIECLERYVALIRLPALNFSTGELEEHPHLYGFFDQEKNIILTVESNLRQLPISPASVNTHIAKKFAEMFAAREEAAS